VTKGLNPNVPMKDSGVDWLGDVPEHWKIGKIKRWFNTLSGGTPDSNNYVRYYKDGTHPWLRTTDLNNGVLTSFEIGITDEAIKESSCKYVPENSVLIAMYGGDGTIGKNALLRFKSTINQALCALIPNTHFNPEYTFFYIQFYRPYWMVNAMGGRKDPNINQQQIQDAYFLQPPIAEQNKIVDFLKKEHSRIDIFVLKQNKLIEKLKEYRSSIISHAVTGKIDVREFSA
jgi:type I restriction enzyme, S subunit